MADGLKPMQQIELGIENYTLTFLLRMISNVSSRVPQKESS
jgi:hypothetical protein